MQEHLWLRYSTFVSNGRMGTFSGPELSSIQKHTSPPTTEGLHCFFHAIDQLPPWSILQTSPVSKGIVKQVRRFVGTHKTCPKQSNLFSVPSKGTSIIRLTSELVTKFFQHIPLIIRKQRCSNIDICSQWLLLGRIAETTLLLQCILNLWPRAGCRIDTADDSWKMLI